MAVIDEDFSSDPAVREAEEEEEEEKEDINRQAS